MKAYEILDRENGLSVGILLYYERSRTSVIELRDGLDEWTAPLLLTSFVKRGIYTIPREISALWVRERVIPSGRQNIGAILKNHKLKEYDEMKFLELSGGHCSQDSLYIKKIPELPRYVTDRMRRNLRDCVLCQDHRLLCFFADDTIRMVDLNELYASAARSETDIKGAGPADHIASDSLTSGNIASDSLVSGNIASGCLASGSNASDRLASGHIASGRFALESVPENIPFEDIGKILRNEALYRSGKITAGGYSVTFNDSIDIAASVLYGAGVLLPLRPDDVLSFINYNVLDTTRTCDILECSRQNLAYMVRQQQLSPVKENVKGNLYLKGDVLRAFAE